MTDTESGGGSRSPFPTAIRRRFAWKFLTVVVMAVTGLVGGAFVAEANQTLENQVTEQVGSTTTLQADSNSR